jgi:glutaredoxin-related protein
MEFIDYAEGTNGAIKVHNTTIELVRKGLNARLLGLRGNKEIQISSITSIQFKEPGMLTNGFIQFSFSGSQERKGGVFDATKDENSVVFTKKNLKNFVMIRDLINQKRDELQNIKYSATTQTNSFADLEKLAELRDKGIVTAEEFEVKKRQILGL